MMHRDVYNYESRYMNAIPIENNMANSHETARSNPRVSLTLRTQNSSLKQIRWIEEDGMCCLTIGPFLVSLLYNL